MASYWHVGACSWRTVWRVGLGRSSARPVQADLGQICVGSRRGLPSALWFFDLICGRCSCTLWLQGCGDVGRMGRRRQRQEEEEAEEDRGNAVN